MDSKIKNTDVIQWRTFLRQLLVSSALWSCYFTFGLCLGTPTVTIPQLRNHTDSTAAVSGQLASWISSAVAYVGTFWVLGLLVLTHYFGRKKVMILVTVNTFTAFTVLYCSKSATHVLISQILHGAVAAAGTTISVMLLAESTSPYYRGLFLTIKSASVFWGMWVANAIGAFFPYNNIGILGIICSIYSFFLILFFVPESPYWLAIKGRYAECEASYRWLKGESENSEQELTDLINDQKLLKRCEKHKSFYHQTKSYFASLIQPEVYKPLGHCVLVYTLYFCSGKLVCAVYAIEIIKKITNSNSTAYIGMLVLDGVTVFGMYVGCYLSKICKRRTLLLTATAIGTLFLYSLSLYLYLVKISIVSENKYLSIILLTGFSLSICCGPMILSTSIAAELTPLKSRNLCFCIIATYSKFILATFLKMCPQLLSAFGTHGTFLLFALGCSLCLIIIYKYLPETKDKTLQEISNMFRKSNTSPRPETTVLM